VTATDEQARGISRKLVLLLAVATGAAVANVYYQQPLLQTLGRAFHVSTGVAGLLVTFSQAGYMLGLVVLVPLGDLLERRRLLCRLLVLTALAQIAAAAAPDYAVFALTTMLVGLTAVVGQIIVPMASQLAGEHERGRVVGTVMSGLLIGVLLARTVSGLIAAAFGWRVVFAVAAVSLVAMAATLWRALPKVEPTSDITYGAALRSVARLIKEEPILRQRMVLGGLGFGCFSILWTALAFLLSGSGGSHYHDGSAVIGLFGLAGVAGAAIAPIAGRMADHGHGRLMTTLTVCTLLVSWGILRLGASSVLVLILGIVVLDFAVQGTHISNQSVIYRLRPQARSRLTTAYMVAYFLGGTICSAVTGALYASHGWSAVCLFGAIVAGLNVTVWLVSESLLQRHALREKAAASAVATTE
jgi:predicted MFS family arabinose efflux permease